MHISLLPRNSSPFKRTICLNPFILAFNCSFRFYPFSLSFSRPFNVQIRKLKYFVDEFVFVRKRIDCFAWVWWILVQTPSWLLFVFCFFLSLSDGLSTSLFFRLWSFFFALCVGSVALCCLDFGNDNANGVLFFG